MGGGSLLKIHLGGRCIAWIQSCWAVGWVGLILGLASLGWHLGLDMVCGPLPLLPVSLLPLKPGASLVLGWDKLPI